MSEFDWEQMERDVVKAEELSVLLRRIFELLKRIYDETERQAGNKPTPAEIEGKILADLDPELAQLIEVYDANGETRVKCKQFIHKKNQWAEINTYLKERGFKWESQGKNSYWHRRG